MLACNSIFFPEPIKVYIFTNLTFMFYALCLNPFGRSVLGPWFKMFPFVRASVISNFDRWWLTPAKGFPATKRALFFKCVFKKCVFKNKTCVQETKWVLRKKCVKEKNCVKKTVTAHFVGIGMFYLQTNYSSCQILTSKFWRLGGSRKRNVFER